MSENVKLCITNLLCFLGRNNEMGGDGSPVDVIYLDFQKALHKVPHQRLISTRSYNHMVWETV